MSIFNYKRRQTSETKLYPKHPGQNEGLGIGGDNPVRLQSMTNTPTADVEQSSAQIRKIVHEGADLVRLTTQGVKEASAIAEMPHIVPLVADVHFNPNAAFRAAETCEKVRINPGNFADPVHRFQTIEYSDEEYAEELSRLRTKLVPFLNKCKECKTALRLGVNHGSLSDRIMSRYGDTPNGMVESAMEFLKVFLRLN